jgi:hypothetical protein
VDVDVGVGVGVDADADVVQAIEVEVVRGGQVPLLVPMLMEMMLIQMSSKLRLQNRQRAVLTLTPTAKRTFQSPDHVESGPFV